MSKIFEKVGARRPQYSAFDLSHERKLSCKMGDLIPTYLQEIVPGDEFKVSTEIMMRLAPMIAPVMHRVNVYMHFFFVPNRIVWNQWEPFITGGQQGTTTPEFPRFDLNGNEITNGSLLDYMGLPTMEAQQSYSISSIPFRAYHQIWSDYFRDPNFESAIDPNTLDTFAELNVIRQRCWEKDYFTSALPWAQRGPEVNIPAEVTYATQGIIVDSAGDPSTDVGYGIAVEASPPGGAVVNAQAANLHNLSTDNPIGITINDLRRSNALQRWLEKNARGGYRYIEQILTHFGVRSSDARLQRAEYLGGGRQPVVISEVLNNTGTEDAAQGTMAGHGISMGTTNSFRKRFEEHGYVIGIMSVLPRTAYQNGIPRHLIKSTREEFYWPEFAHLGEQEIKKGEVWFDVTADEDENNETWGYQQRFAEYKYGVSSVHGDFQDSLDYWHLGRVFGGPTPLNADFVRSNPTDRIFAVTDGTDYLWVQLYNDVKARRPMPYFADPRL